MKQIIIALLILICIAAPMSCKMGPDAARQKPDTQPKDSPAAESLKKHSTDTVEILGTVVYKDFEGGFFAIDGDDGSNYDPINLPESFRKDGLKVKVSARLRRDMGSFHMYGTIIEIVDIAAR